MTCSSTRANLHSLMTGQAVLVTGASTGIGRSITEYLAARGCSVYAGARAEADLKALGELANVTPVRLDVTDSRHILAVVDLIKSNGRGLYGLVNNAGIATHSPVVNGNDAEFDLVMAVNVRALYRITKACAPLIIAAKGRIVNVGSVAAVLANPGFSVYSMSKASVEVFTDSLAEELSSAGAGVSVVEPGQFRSELVKNFAARGGVVPAFAEGVLPPGPESVAAAVSAALFEPDPKRRYLVVATQNEADRTIRKGIARLVQLNEGQPFTFDRTSLIAMLDEALACARPKCG